MHGGFEIVSVFVFKQKTAYEMRISDWSSDVCSSDLADGAHPVPRDRRAGRIGRVAAAAAADLPGHYRAVAHLLRGQPVHLRHGTPADGHAADPRPRHGRRSCALCRPGSADRKSTRLNSSHSCASRMPSSTLQKYNTTSHLLITTTN